jgi:two-component system CheB/CheR fusion protein
MANGGRKTMDNAGDRPGQPPTVHRTSGASSQAAEPPESEAGLDAPTSDAARAEAALRATERRFGEAQQLAGIGVWEWNIDTEESWWSPVVYRLWGLPHGEAPPPIGERRVHPEDLATYEAAIDAARVTGELDAELRVVLPDGSIRWLSMLGRLERSTDARRILGVTQDITDRRLTEMRLRLRLGELQHRVRNILGVVRSIVSRTVQSATNVDDLASHLDGRLATLGRTQAILTRTSEAAVDLEEVLRDEMVAVAAVDGQITISGPVVRMRGEAAQTVALALHELTTNAVKYGALSEPNGRLSVRWRVMNTRTGPRLSLEWKEAGVRALDTRPTHNGFGRELLERGLPYELGATTSIDFARGGLRAVVEMPLSEKVAVLDGLDGGEDTE